MLTIKATLDYSLDTLFMTISAGGGSVNRKADVS